MRIEDCKEGAALAPNTAQLRDSDSKSSLCGGHQEMASTNQGMRLEVLLLREGAAAPTTAQLKRLQLQEFTAQLKRLQLQEFLM